MVRLREIPRTAVFAWVPGSGSPLIVTGTRTGAVSDDFSSEIKVELWELGLEKLDAEAELKPAGGITTDSGFNDIAWSEPTDEHPLGVIAGALENGSVDLWDAEKLRKGGEGAFISRTTKHSGPAKGVQFNPHRHSLLASVGAKGEIFIYDLGNMANPFKLGGAVARADDIECLDWNKQEKTAHILATGSAGGFVTVWDVKQKRDILTLNNQGRKAVSAVAWDPEESTKLATATPNDQDPLILLWSLRNSSAPERILKGHELGVLGLAWCQQDSELLLSCGKDNKTICWDPKTGQHLGDFAAGSNWAFQTKWNPHNPSLIASASFDGKIMVTSTQSTNSRPEDQAAANQALDDQDFFAKAQAQPQSITFSIAKAPKWAARPTSVSFGFGGRLVRVASEGAKRSKVAIDTFEADSSIGEATTKFEEVLRSGDVAGVCQSKIEDAKTEEEKADWQVIETLNAGKSRKKLREYLGFSEETDKDSSDRTEKVGINGDGEKGTSNGEDDFFGGADDGNFLAHLAATKGAKTNNPFSIYTDKESEADKAITRALMLGQFEAALDTCLKEKRMSDAFMIAVCGGQDCIDKAQNAYLKEQASGPSYLRLLASIVGKNLWDVVHNADIQNWKEVMATLCTYAEETEFSDLCEALGDRLEEAYQESNSSKPLRRDASFCYLAGSKLEKVVVNWIEEFEETEKSALASSEGDNDFAIHARALQDFVEKVSVFRKVTNFQDADLQAAEGFKLAPLYRLYVEYADILAAHGRLAGAERYLDLLPGNFDGAESAQSRIKQATRKNVAAVQRQPAAAQRAAPGARAPSVVPSLQPPAPLINKATNAAPRGAAASPYAPTGATTAAAAPRGPYAPPASNYAPSPYQPPTQGGAYGQPGAYGPGYQPPQQQAPLPPPPRAGTVSPSMPPPSAARNIPNWNDMPEGFLKDRQPNSRKGTPGPQAIVSPFPNSQPLASPPPMTGPPQFGTNKPTPPLPPPPKAGEAPTRANFVTAAPALTTRPSSSAANAYAPSPSSQPSGPSTLPTPALPPVARGASPYQPPPSVSTAAPSSRYAPAPGAAPSPAPHMPPQRQVAPNPYAAQAQSPYASQQQAQQGGPPQPQGPPSRAGPPPQGPPRGPPQSSTPGIPPPPQGPSRSGAPAAAQPPPQTERSSTPARARHPRGDRSHIPASAQPIVDLLAPEVGRIKAMAPQAFKPQVEDMDKRINILFDHLNNEDLLRPETVGQMVEIARAVHGREWDRAQGQFASMQAEKLETEGTHWMVSLCA